MEAVAVNNRGEAFDLPLYLKLDLQLWAHL
jgi:hypothetical protein